MFTLSVGSYQWPRRRIFPLVSIHRLRRLDISNRAHTEIEHPQLDQIWNQVKHRLLLKQQSLVTKQRFEDINSLAAFIQPCLFIVKTNLMLNNFITYKQRSSQCLHKSKLFQKQGIPYYGWIQFCCIVINKRKRSSNTEFADLSKHLDDKGNFVFCPALFDQTRFDTWIVQSSTDKTSRSGDELKSYTNIKTRLIFVSLPINSLLRPHHTRSISNTSRI